MDSEILAFSRLLKDYGCLLTFRQMRQFEDYLNLLVAWSKRTNLVSRNDLSRLVSRHFVDSVAVLYSVDVPQDAVVLDLGTGAGFPGVPIKIMRPDLSFVLLDSKRMKSLFLRKVVAELSLENVVVLCDRVENIANKHAKFFDLIVTRAVTTLDDLWEWGVPLLKNNGKLLAMKGGDLDVEIELFKARFGAVQVTVDFYPEMLIRDVEKKIVTLQSMSLL